MRRVIGAVAPLSLAAVFAFGGCGGDETTIIQTTPQTTATDTAPPPDEPARAKPEDYFVSKAVWKSYSAEYQRRAVETFLGFNREACQDADVDGVLNFVNSVWISTSDPGVKRLDAGEAMFHYCAKILGGEKNLPPDFDY